AVREGLGGGGLRRARASARGRCRPAPLRGDVTRRVGGERRCFIRVPRRARGGVASPSPQRERRGEPRFEHARPCRVTLAEEGGSSEPSPRRLQGAGSSGDRHCLTGEALAG
ncbi:hypothetical protein DV515_00015046, partial [Chloebia gouldiae]